MSTLYTDEKIQGDKEKEAVFRVKQQFEKRPNRFDNLFKRNPREWAYWMIDCGWGEVLDYIGIGWRNEGDDIYINERRCKNGNN